MPNSSSMNIKYYFKKSFISTATLLLCIIFFSVNTPVIYSQDSIFIDDNFDCISDEWIRFSLDSTIPQIDHFSGKIRITTNKSCNGGMYNKIPLSGNFIAEVDFLKDQNVMVALFHKKTDGTIDVNNYTALCVDFFGDHVEVFVTDKQNGIKDVLDNTYKVNIEKYNNRLDGSVYSLPFTGTDKKLRIFKNNLSGFIHFYYSVKKNIKGVTKTDWMELFPSKEWGGNNKEYLIGLMSSGGSVEYSNVKVKTVPEKDQSDKDTGFKVTERKYTWAGYTGNAIVVSFGNAFAYRNKDYKWVFWDKFNYIPAWQFSNELQYTYEFIEVWDANMPGCFEPMSDRLLRYSNVEIIEDNPVRKVIHWHYALLNPDYRYPDDWKEGTEMPEVDEYYYIYPDGQIVRRILYFPKLDTSYRCWHDLTEAIVVSGVQSNASHHLASPALSVFDLNNNFRHFFGDNTTDKFDSDNWESYIISTHFKYHPDAVGAFIQEFKTGKQLRMVLDWHSPFYKFAHWPVNKVIYEEEHKTFTPWKEMVSHTSLIGGSSRTGTDWNSNFKYKDNRKFREWSQLLFLNDNNEFTQEQNIVKSWKGAIEIINVNSDFVYDKYDKNQKVFEFNNFSGFNKIFRVKIKPDNIIINPVIKVKNWGNAKIKIKLNNIDADFRYHIYENNDLIVWIKTELTTLTSIEISPESYTNTKKETHLDANVRFYPNPVSDILYIKLNEHFNNTRIRVLDIAGRLLFSGTINTNPFMFDFSSFNSDIYFVNVFNDKINITKQIIKNK